MFVRTGIVASFSGVTEAAADLLGDDTAGLYQALNIDELRLTMWSLFWLGNRH